MSIQATLLKILYSILFLKLMIGSLELMKKALLLFFFISNSISLFADVIVTPASGGTNLSQQSPNVNEGWATLGDISIIEEDTDDIEGGQTDVTLILSAPPNWEFFPGSGVLFAIGDIMNSDINPPSLIVTSFEIILTFSTRSEGNSGSNEFDVIVFEGVRVRPIDPTLVPSEGRILRTGGTAIIVGGDVSDSLNYGDLSLDEDDPLPVEISSFTALSVNEKINLTWETVSEINNYGFDVERSTDKLQWYKISFVEGSGNSNTVNKYCFTDSPKYPGKFYYRLKQIDTDGSFNFSFIIEADISLLTDFELLQNYPNPFNPFTKISFVLKDDTHAELKLYDLAGNFLKELFRGKTEAGKIYNVEFDGSFLSSGVYYYSLITPAGSETKKMILLK
jgi:hypothetical protein